jgi:hypothetical protein
MKTAVEFAFEELNKWRVETFGEFALIGIPQEVLDKAKEMEKAEKIRTQIDCWEKALKIIPREDEDRILLRVEDLKQQLKKLEDESKTD